MPPKALSKTVAQPKATQTGAKNKKFTPRPPLPTAERLPKLYRALTDQVNDGYFDNAKKTCKKILALDSESNSAFQTLLFILLHTDDYAAALALVDTPPSASAGPLLFERAYCLYRLHREREALEVLQKIEAHGRREQHLEAQVRYRLGGYENAQELYKGLISGVSTSSSEYEDIRTNQASTAAQLNFISQGYHAHLSAPAVENPAAGLTAYTPSAGELETHVPSVPIGWATSGAGAGIDKKNAAANASASSSQPPAPKQDKAPRTKPRHKLPKDAVPGKPFTQDPDRWLPLRQRASFLNATAGAKKKGGKEQTGLGTQGSMSTGGAASGGGSNGGGGKGGGKKKKGKK